MKFVCSCLEDLAIFNLFLYKGLFFIQTIIRDTINHKISIIIQRRNIIPKEDEIKYSEDNKSYILSQLHIFEVEDIKITHNDNFACIIGIIALKFKKNDLIIEGNNNQKISIKVKNLYLELEDLSKKMPKISHYVNS